MALLSSSGLTDTPSASNVVGPSALTQPYVSDVLSKGQALLNNPAPQYTGQLTAGTSDIQNKAWQGLSNLTLPTAMTTAGGNLLNIGQAAQGVNYTPVGSGLTADQATQYMNPYLKASLDPQLAEIQRQYGITGAQEMGNATKVGAFGGSREALMAAENERNKNMAMNTAIGQGYNTAYDKATAQFNADQARKIQEAQYGTDTGLKALSTAATANQAAGNVGTNEAQYGLQNLTALGTAGNTQQAQNQAGLNALYNQYLEQRNYPGTLLANQANLIKGIGGQATNTYGAKPSTLQSAVNTAAGTAALIKNLKDSGIDSSSIDKILKSAGINPSTLTSATYNPATGLPTGTGYGDEGSGYTTDSLGNIYKTMPDGTSQLYRAADVAEPAPAAPSGVSTEDNNFNQSQQG
jgi:hypothetical protein